MTDTAVQVTPEIHERSALFRDLIQWVSRFPGKCIINLKRPFYIFVQLDRLGGVPSRQTNQNISQQQKVYIAKPVMFHMELNSNFNSK